MLFKANGKRKHRERDTQRDGEREAERERGGRIHKVRMKEKER